jgi:hypothetical protein
MVIDFRHMSFEDSVKLFDRFMEYRRAGESAERIRNAGKKSRREVLEDNSKEMFLDQTAWARGLCEKHYYSNRFESRGLLKMK